MENNISFFFIVCKMGYDKIVELLLRNGVDIFLCMKDGYSLFYIVC